ncbi:AraC family transcriptional regulator [Aromatoleum petrolei]|uniref:Helix-turn-helix domain-containing protein n=1 Tax=Aromatoleum petrolei TaxID=76116 RepID=A0ABX1MXA5_9RHOO|nr:AraC family transcriptional regulator [Aromatoleum petrolei]NMF90960.1 helix-turn-helix domain-containing protein [Aromatoleum petrolei]QTQ35426.1 Transcriptional regulator, AraC family [Aromatoleum petrolei]
MSQDTLSDLLRSVRLRGAVFYYVSCWEDWAAEAPPAREIAPAVLPGAEHVIEFHMVARGAGWAAVSGLPPARLETGDIVMFPQGDAHVMSSAPGVAPARIEPDWVFATRNDPRPMPVAYHRGVREPGAPAPVGDADTILVCGFLGCDLRPFNPLVAALPRLLHLPAARAGDWVARVIDQAARESTERRPGSDVVLERLAEMMFVDTARRYLEGLPDDATGWLAGLRDRYVGRALALLHERPDRPWTIDELGREVGLSRSALHERFVQFLAEPPMHYLANWRIQLGSRLLRESSRTVAAIAQEVGYESEAAFSRAFKRLVGLPPATWRRRLSAPPQA